MQNEWLNNLQDILPRDATIVQVGGGAGDLAKQMVDILGPDVSILIFEPLSILYWKVSDRFIYNEQVKTRHMALGSECGKGVLQVSTNHVNSSSLYKPLEHLKVWPDIKFDEWQNVCIRTLDIECSDIDIDFLIIDTNGADLDVLKGGTKTIKRTSYLMVEYHNRRLYEAGPTLKELVDYLSEFDLVNTFDDEGAYGNALFKRKTSNE